MKDEHDDSKDNHQQQRGKEWEFSHKELCVVLRRKWGRWFYIRSIYLAVRLFLRFLRLLNHLLCQLLNQLLSLFRSLPLPGHWRPPVLLGKRLFAIPRLVLFLD
jgi:hypothetical protein